MNEPADGIDPALSEAVESVFDASKFAELKITVRLPAECSPTGEPIVYGQTQLVFPDDVRMENLVDVLPKELQRIMRLLEMSLRFR